MNAQLYRRPNRRKCYWLCQDCIKGHSHRCSPKCPDYLSVARAERIKREGETMPIRWSTVKVSETVNEIDELVNSIRPTLWRMREKAQELRLIPNLPEYIAQPTVTMTSKVDNFNSYVKGYVERIRNLIPKEALEDERKAIEYGRQQSLI